MHKFYKFSLIIFLIIIFGLLILNETTGHFFNTNDYYFHLYRTQGACFSYYPEINCDSYAPLFAIISIPFQTEQLFILFVLFILVFLIPFLIYEKTYSIFSLLIYYTSSFVFNVLFASIFAQMLVTVFLILIIRNREFSKMDLIYYCLGCLSHNVGFLLLTPIILLKFVKLKEIPFFPFALVYQRALSVSTIFKLQPFVLWFYALFLDIKEVLILFGLFVGGFLNERVILFIPVLLALWLPIILELRPKKVKYLLYLNFALMFIFQAVIWFLDVYQSNLIN